MTGSAYFIPRMMPFPCDQSSIGAFTEDCLGLIGRRVLHNEESDRDCGYDTLPSRVHIARAVTAALNQETFRLMVGTLVCLHEDAKVWKAKSP